MAKSMSRSKKRVTGVRHAVGKSEHVVVERVVVKKSPSTIETGPPSVEFKTTTRFMLSSGYVDVDTLAAEFNVTKAALAQSLGFAEETLQRSARASAQKTQQRLREMLEILTRVEPWAGGMPQAMGWYRGQGIAALGDQTAEALVKNDQAAVVRAYLDAIATGAFA
jgi:hypothetical protein